LQSISLVPRPREEEEEEEKGPGLRFKGYGTDPHGHPDIEQSSPACVKIFQQ